MGKSNKYLSKEQLKEFEKQLCGILQSFKERVDKLEERVEKLVKKHG